MATLASRASGLARTMVLAAVLGVGLASDAYNVANTAPTMVFTLVAGGALSAAVVPTLVRAEENRAEVASVLLGATLLIGTVVSILFALAAPALFRLLTLGGRDRSGYDEFARLGGSWLEMFAPQVGLYALSVLAVAIMTAQRRLVLGAAAPVATNLITIIAAVSLGSAGVGALATGDISARDRALLGWGTTVAVGAMTAIQLWGACRCVPGLRPRVQLRHPAVVAVRRVAGWTVLYVGANQAGLAAVTALASSVVGGVTAYQWGFAVMQLPYAVVAVSLLASATPMLAAARTVDERSLLVVRPGRWIVFGMLPAATMLAVAAHPVASIVVGPPGASLVGAAIVGFALSLVPFSLFQLLVRASYAADDARSPATVNIFVNLVNIVGAAAAFAAWSGVGRVTGLAAAHGLSYVFGCVLLGRRLKRRGVLDIRLAVAGVARLGILSGFMAVALVVARSVLAEPASRSSATVVVAVLAIVGGATWCLVGHWLGVLRWVRHRIAPTESDALSAYES